MTTPEERARETIGKKLVESEWIVQSRHYVNPDDRREPSARCATGACVQAAAEQAETVLNSFDSHRRLHQR